MASVLLATIDAGKAGLSALAGAKNPTRADTNKLAQSADFVEWILFIFPVILQKAAA
jgi:hypothetical protein